MIQLTDETFKEEIKEGLVVVDCYAPWCGKCKMLKPKLEELSAKYKICMLDVDVCQKATADLNISRVPTIIVFDNGVESMRGDFNVLSTLEASWKN